MVRCVLVQREQRGYASQYYISITGKATECFIVRDVFRGPSMLGSSRCRWFCKGNSYLPGQVSQACLGLWPGTSHLQPRFIFFPFYFYSPSSLMIPLPSLLQLVGCGKEAFFSGSHCRAVSFLGFSFDIIKITFGCGYVIPLTRSMPALKIPLRKRWRIGETAASFLHQEMECYPWQWHSANRPAQIECDQK